MSKYFVIAGNHDQFSEWRRRNGTEMLLNGQIENLSDIIYVSSIDQLKGYSNPKGVFIGTWYQRKDIEDIILQLRMSITDIERTKPLSKVNQLLACMYSKEYRE